MIGRTTLHNKLVVFDIETIIDCDAGRRLLGLPKSLEDSEIIKQLEQYHLDITDGKNKFIRQPFHKIVAISFLVADIVRSEEGEFYNITDLRSGGSLDSGEKELVSGFFRFLEKSRPRLITFNGRTFDLPVLKYRAMVHQIEAKWYYQAGDKWNSYNSRYSLDWHCDLLEAFSDFGTSARVKMHEVCAALGLPGKVDTDGSQVLNLFNSGKLDEIRNYCELDVINTYLLYLVYSQHIGNINIHNYNKCLQGLEDFLSSNPKDNFSKFLSAWSVQSNLNSTKLA